MKRISALVFACVISLSFFSEAKAAEISSDTSWSGEVNITENTELAVGKTLTVEKGTNVTFSEDVVFKIYGTLDVRGTVLEPVTITGEGYSIQAFDNGKITIRNADISGGGKVIPSYVDTNGITRPEAHIGAVTAAGKGKVEVQATTFHDNEVAAMATLTSVQTGRLIVQRSNFEDNSRFDAVNYNPQVRHDFNYNWWGNPVGPTPGKLFRNFSTDHPRASAELRDPVIIIPGITGSYEYSGNWILEPFFHTYDGLVESLKENGYVEGQDLYVFPYDWYRSNVLTANDLRVRINEIRLQRNWPRVDIVAHSMGGLVARQYIENSSYNNDVDQLITLGTPHNGSPEAYLTWEAGSFGRDLGGILYKYVFSQIAHSAGITTFEFIRSLPIASIQELLPTYAYLKEADTGEIRNYPNDYPFNSFLDSLFQPQKLAKLKLVEFTNIIGNLSQTESTIGIIRVEDIGAESGEEWEHGKPEDYDSVIGDQGLERKEGDHTVPLISASNISSDLELTLNSMHGDLPTEAASQVYSILTGDTGFTGIDTVRVDSMLVVSVFSPIDIQMVSPSGKKLGKNFETGEEYSEIEGAFYSGYDTEEEFITIPNPEDGEYKILTQGTGEGDYRIQVSKISEGDSPAEEAIESTVNFEGVAQEGVEEEKQVVVTGTEVSEELPDTEAPQIAIVSPEGREYLNNGNINFEYTVSDNVSLLEDITTEAVFDGIVTTETAKDLSLLPLGEHTLSITATDEAGNVSTQAITFSVATSLHALRQNVQHYSELGFIKKPGVKKFLIQQAQKVENLIKAKESLHKVPWLKRWRLEEKIDKQIQKRIKFIEKYIDQQVRKKNIDNIAASLLKDTLREIEKRYTEKIEASKYYLASQHVLRSFSRS